MTARASNATRERMQRELTDRERRAIIDAHASDATMPAIAGRFGITEERLRGIWAQAGLGRRNVGACSPTTKRLMEKRAGVVHPCVLCGRSGERVRYKLGKNKGWRCVDRDACAAARAKMEEVAG